MGSPDLALSLQRVFHSPRHPGCPDSLFSSPGQRDYRFFKQPSCLCARSLAPGCRPWPWELTCLALWLPAPSQQHSPPVSLLLFRFQHLQAVGFLLCAGLGVVFCSGRGYLSHSYPEAEALLRNPFRGCGEKDPVAASQAPDWPTAPLATSNSPRSFLVSAAGTWATGSAPFSSCPKCPDTLSRWPPREPKSHTVTICLWNVPGFQMCIIGHELSLAIRISRFMRKNLP